MGSHLIDGEFQSDRYPTTPRGKVPLSVTDPAAQPLLWEYAQRRRAGSHGSKEADKEFADDLEEALKLAGFTSPTRTTAFVARHGTSPEINYVEPFARKIREMREALGFTNPVSWETMVVEVRKMRDAQALAGPCAECDEDLVPALTVGNPTEKRLAMEVKNLRGAIKSANLRLGQDLLYAPTLWCIECERDSGMHHETCSRISSDIARAVDRKTTNLEQRLEGATQANQITCESLSILLARKTNEMIAPLLARLDADRTTKSLTRIIHHPPAGGRVGAGGPLFDPELEAVVTGERTPLIAPEEPEEMSLQDEAFMILASKRKPLPPAIMIGVIKTARESFRNDGAEGETVHRLCDEVERLTDLMKAARQFVFEGPGGRYWMVAQHQSTNSIEIDHWDICPDYGKFWRLQLTQEEAFAKVQRSANRKVEAEL